ncbi:MAG: hypothetical protein ACF8GE_10140 [Phycisphaerales bacterium JB043]
MSDGYEPTDPGGGASDGLALTLSGSLPCIGCGYELRGLSVLGNCPECGTAVRATVLYKVDPHADALRELRNPRLVVVMLPLWVIGGVLAVLASWVPRVDEIVRAASSGEMSFDVAWSGWFVIVPALASWVGACLGLIRLHKGGVSCECRAAVVGCLCYIPLICLLYYLYFHVDARGVLPYTGTGADSERLIVRLGVALSMTGILLGLRPNARMLVQRCLALRSGRVDRQTMYATIAAVWLAGAGDALRWIATGLPSASEMFVDRTGIGLVAVGSMLVTAAVFSMMVDGLRIERSIRMPSPRPEDVLGIGRDPS